MRDDPLDMALAHRPPDLPEDQVQQAVATWREENPGRKLFEANLSDIYARARTLERPTGGLFAGLAWTEIERIRRALEPWAEEVRRAVEERAGDGTALPLGGLTAARRWIEAQSGAGGKRAGPREFAGAVREMREYAEELTRRLGVRVRPAAIDPLVVPYLVAGSRTVHHVVAPPGSALGVLAVAVAEIAEATGFHPARIAAYVLADVPPTLAPVLVESRPHWHAERGIGRMEVVVRFHRPPTVAEMRDLGRRVREEWETTRRGRPESERTRRVVELVRRGKTPPSTVAEWERINARLDREGVGRYRDWRGPHKAWARHRERLDREL